MSKRKGCSLPFRALSSSACASGDCTAVIWLLHSSGGLEVGMVVDPNGGYVLAPDSQEGLCEKQALLMFNCTIKRTFALKRADVIADGRGSCRDGCHREARHAGFVFPLP